MKFNFQTEVEGIGCSRPDPTFRGPRLVRGPEQQLNASLKSCLR
jgi:hypothetical protein